MHAPLDAAASSLLAARPSVRQLAEALAAGALTAEDACRYYLQRIERWEPRLRALTYCDPQRALDEARRLDQRFAADGPLGPLHGLPCTIKDCYHLQGADTTLGLTHLQGQPAAEDGQWVRRLREAGAVILGKTNVPQLMLLHETDNPVHGRTNNPWNLDRSCGGSSGGEGAAIASGETPWGLGTDLGGSIRVPGHFCGIAGLKPTAGRLGIEGMFLNFEHLEGFALQPGPMAPTAADVAWLMNVLTAIQGCDGAPPWRNPDSVRPADLRIGVLASDGLFEPSPAIARVVGAAAEELRRQGAMVTQLQLPQWSEAVSVYFRLMGADGGRYFRGLLKQGQADGRLRQLTTVGGLPRWLRSLAVGGLRLLGQPGMANLIRDTGALSERQRRELLDRARRLQHEMKAELARQCDVWIAPPYALPAIRHGASVELLNAASYAYVPNFLDLPCGVIPASRVLPEEQVGRRGVWQLGQRQARRCERQSAGLPVGLQVIGQPWREDQVLSVMLACEAYFCDEPGYPRTPPEFPADADPPSA